MLIHAAGTPQTAFSVTVDAKSKNTGNVTENLVDFDTILEHKKKHNADFAAIVGGSFQNERLIRRAKEHGVVLIDVETLETLIKNRYDGVVSVETEGGGSFEQITELAKRSYDYLNKLIRI